MLLAVAGLKAEEIKQRARKMATGDWSDFPPVEAQAFAFAYRMSKKPSSVSDQEVQDLVKTFGTHRALDVIWQIAWCNYMTRVADALQLPLEEENVFQPAERKEPTGKLDK